VEEAIPEKDVALLEDLIFDDPGGGLSVDASRIPVDVGNILDLDASCILSGQGSRDE